MLPALPQISVDQPSSTEVACLQSIIGEFMVFCPGCKTLETLWFNDCCLLPTRKFNQYDGQILHDCGSSEPCKLYRV
jgi:hypothetical protein